MRAVHSEHTGPELIVRSAAHRLVLCFRLHDSKLPGRPDMVFPKWKTIIFVHGCYWHRHRGCRKATTPKSNDDFWKEKFSANRAGNRRNVRELTHLGWRVLVVWQCETKSIATLTTFLTKSFPRESRIRR